jgi:hypothetical protein
MSILTILTLLGLTQKLKNASSQRLSLLKNSIQVYQYTKILVYWYIFDCGSSHPKKNFIYLKVPVKNVKTDSRIVRKTQQSPPQCPPNKTKEISKLISMEILSINYKKLSEGFTLIVKGDRRTMTIMMSSLFGLIGLILKTRF